MFSTCSSTCSINFVAMPEPILTLSGNFSSPSSSWDDADALYHPLLCLDDFQCVAGDFEAGAGFRDILEVFQHQTVERFRPIQREAQTKLAIELAQGRGAVHQPAAVFLEVECGGTRWRLRSEFSDNFFENIFQRHQ